MLYVEKIENHKLGAYTPFEDIAKSEGWTITIEEANTERSDIDFCLYEKGFAPMKSDEQKAQEEKERISHLKCTKRVLALCLQEYGITYTQLKELIATNEQAQLEWELCVELERNNPLLDIMGAELNITPEQIDKIFLFANGEIKSVKIDV